MSTAPLHPGRHDRPHRRSGGVLLAALALAALVTTLLLLRSPIADAPTRDGGATSAASQTRALPSFTALRLVGQSDIVVRVGRPQRVVVHTDRALLPRVTTSVHAGELRVDTALGTARPTHRIRVTVDVPTLARLTLAGAGTIGLSGLHGPAATIELPGSGTITAAGQAARLRVDVRGSGVAELGGVDARDVRATLSGTGAITVTARHSLRATLSGTGTILYRGHPSSISRQTSGTGLIAPTG